MEIKRTLLRPTPGRAWDGTLEGKTIELKEDEEE